MTNYLLKQLIFKTMKTCITKLLYVATILSLSTLGAFAQKERANVGIGTTQPDESAVLDIKSSTKGVLMPRMSLQERNAIQNPANGLIVYQTDMLSGFYFYDGKNWKPLTTTTDANSVAGVDGDWTLLGNAAPAGSFIGTTNATPLEFRVNNVRFGYLSPTQTTLGNQALLANTSGLYNLAIGEYALYGNTTGSYNAALGSSALEKNNGTWNSAIGYQTLQNNTSGAYNVGIGGRALFSNTTGISNMAIGVNALYTNTTGNENTAIGVNALNGTIGNSNIGIGNEAGMNKNGTGNIYIGAFAGRTSSLTAESNTLYIANSNTTTPLVYGDFATKYLAVGEVAAADRAAATSGGYRLLVKGGMITEKIKVAVAGSADWADYVFEPSYKLMSLDKVESFVKENKHLPNVPSAEEMSKNGLDVMQTSAKLMEKIEELTLYMIEMNKEIKALKAENAKLKK
ncbi:hypothetical protein GCM10011514_30580 [Emticicia aquatilis]|uniref:Peptidase S74 domain-containing protein n=2 Tax=Emticicia aquatilis TaxID=1537369 RepID=A0A916YW28_9BACT|nr:hypothetical protein GCM10011514_30580 [Emticicia aquatilis]